MGKIIDLTEQKFGRLTVVSLAKVERKAYWLCRCDCGKEVVLTSSSLRTGHTKSCGCLHNDLSKKRLTKLNKSRSKHGESDTRLYEIWIGIVKRCYKPKFWAFNRYGGRGILMDESWKNDFLNFKEWALSHGYSEKLTIDRINNDGNYQPDNCRWVDRKTQANNRSNVKRITHNGETKTVSEWAEIIGVNYATLYSRIYAYNIPIEEALTPTKYSIGKRGGDASVKGISTRNFR